MKIPPAEILDRMSILKLKIERIGNPILNKEYGACKEALEEYRKEGIEIKKEWLDELYEVNKKEWDLLEKMYEEKKKNKNYEKIGKLYLETEKVNKKRAEIKNKIVKETGKGFLEIKKSHPGED